MLCYFRWEAGDERFGFVQSAKRDQCASLAAYDLGIVRIHLRDLREDRKGAFMLAPREHFLPHGDQRRDFLLQRLFIGFYRKLCQQLVKILLELPFRPRLRQIGHRLTLKNGINRRDRLHAKLACDKAVFIDIDLDQLNALGGIVGADLFDYRGQLLAGAAPFGPKIDNDQTGARRIDDVAAKCLHCRLFSLAQSQGRHVVISCQVGPSRPLPYSALCGASPPWNKAGCRQKV